MMPDLRVSPMTLACIERIAGVVRSELGAEIDAYPGARSPEGADPLNRVFGAIGRVLLAQDDVPEPDLASTFSRALHQLGLRRLTAEGWDEIQVKTLIEQEPGSPDDWLIFLILSDRSQIEPLLDPDQS